MARTIPNLGRLDANETLFFLRQLENQDPTKYKNLYTAFKARRFIPLAQGIPDWATSHRYKMYELVGQAALGSPDNTQLRPVTVVGREVQRDIKSIQTKYSYTYDEIRQSRATGAELDAFLVEAARSAIESKIETIMAIGDSTTNLQGLLNHTGVSATTLTTKTAGGTTWAVATATEIIADITKMISETMSALAEGATSGGMDNVAFERFVLLLPPAEYVRIANMARGTGTDITVLAWLLQNNPFLEGIESWNPCASVSSATRAFLYPRSSLCVQGIINQEYTELAPQAEDFAVSVPCQAKCGGVMVRYPLACRYATGL